jgi:hypothetical protein
MYAVQEHTRRGLEGWVWDLVTARPSYEEAVGAATSWAAHRDLQGIVPFGMRVLDPEGIPIWDNIDTLQERRQQQIEGRTA